MVKVMRMMMIKMVPSSGLARHMRNSHPNWPREVFDDDKYDHDQVGEEEEGADQRFTF